MILDRSKKEMVSLTAIAVLFFISIALVESFALETNTDRPGMDYTNFELDSANPRLCEQAFNSDPESGLSLTSIPVCRDQTPDAG